MCFPFKSLFSASRPFCDKVGRGFKGLAETLPTATKDKCFEPLTYNKYKQYLKCLNKKAIISNMC